MYHKRSRIMRYNKTTYLLILIGAFLITSEAFSQIAKYQKIEKTGAYNFNYVAPERRWKKDKDVFVVYSDRNDNKAYTNAYFQKKLSSQKLLTPYFVIGRKNGCFELVKADSSKVGKPKGFFSPLMGRKRHFKDAKSVEYIGWIPVQQLLLHHSAFTDFSNNKPIKYKVGVSTPEGLLEKQLYFANDSLWLFKDPTLKGKSKQKIKINETVYAFKYSQNKEAVLISNKPIVRDTISQLIGWVSAKAISPVGQGKVYKLVNDYQHTISSDECDSLSLGKQTVRSNYVYNTSNSLIEHQKTNPLSVPFYVWDHTKGKLINVKGDYLPITEIARMDKERKKINFHFFFDAEDVQRVKPLLNALQNTWLSLSEMKDITPTFSAVCIGKNTSYSLLKTTSFEEWLYFIENPTKTISGTTTQSETDLAAALLKTLPNYGPNSFESNFYIIVGTNELHKISGQNPLLSKMAQNSAIVLFAQIENNPDGASQNFLLYAKEILSKISKYRTAHLENYIVDNQLITEDNSLKNIADEQMNIYVYDAPKNSLFNGGLVFPQLYKRLTPAALNTAMDSILVHNKLTQEKLITSLENYKNNLGVIYSEPSVAAKCFFKGEEAKLSQIKKDNINEIFFDRFQTDKNLYLDAGLELTKEEITDLIDNYRSLLPDFNELNNTNKKLLKRLYMQQIRNINRIYNRKVIRRGAPLSELFSRKTSIFVNDTKEFNSYNSNEVNTKKAQKQGFDTFYHKLIDKVNQLEKLFLENKIEKTENNTYFLPNKLLL